MSTLSENERGIQRLEFNNSKHEYVSVLTYPALGAVVIEKRSINYGTDIGFEVPSHATASKISEQFARLAEQMREEEDVLGRATL